MGAGSIITPRGSEASKASLLTVATPRAPCGPTGAVHATPQRDATAQARMTQSHPSRRSFNTPARPASSPTALRSASLSRAIFARSRYPPQRPSPSARRRTNVLIERQPIKRAMQAGADADCSRETCGTMGPIAVRPCVPQEIPFPGGTRGPGGTGAAWRPLRRNMSREGYDRHRGAFANGRARPSGAPTRSARHIAVFAMRSPCPQCVCNANPRPIWLRMDQSPESARVGHAIGPPAIWPANQARHSSRGGTSISA